MRTSDEPRLILNRAGHPWPPRIFNHGGPFSDRDESFPKWGDALSTVRREFEPGSLMKPPRFRFFVVLAVAKVTGMSGTAQYGRVKHRRAKNSKLRRLK